METAAAVKASAPGAANAFPPLHIWAIPWAPMAAPVAAKITASRMAATHSSRSWP